MKVNILGGGPAGLYLAILLRLQGHDITVAERNRPDSTFGWGVVFSDRTIHNLAQADPPTHQALCQRMRGWENVDIIYREQLTSVAGNRFAGIARLDLLQILQGRCQELGVDLRYGCEIEELDPWLQADLVVGSDGVRSRLREQFSERFGASTSLGSNRYIWYGTRADFGGLTLTFRSQGPDLLMAHSYKYNEELSTFIVELDQETWSRWSSLSEPEARERLEQIFAPELKGQPLLSNQSRWIQFVNVSNRHWWSGNLVLLGDALRTAHFSIGSGTKLALEDALALAQALQQQPQVEAALAAFEAARRPGVERLVQAANTSQRWFEQARSKMHLEVLPFCYECMTRSARIDEAELRRRDPVFAQAYYSDLQSRSH